MLTGGLRKLQQVARGKVDSLYLWCPHTPDPFGGLSPSWWSAVGEATSLCSIQLTVRVRLKNLDFCFLHVLARFPSSPLSSERERGEEMKVHEDICDWLRN